MRPASASRTIPTPGSLVRSLLLALVLLSAALLAGRHAHAREPVLLVASPQLADPNFRASVVLVVFPENGAPTGVVLNRRVDIPWAEAFAEDGILSRLQDPIYLGGPVRPDMLWYLVRSTVAPIDSFPVLGDLHLSTDGSFLDEWLIGNGRIERFFVGYAGWTAAQLEREIESGAWYVLPAELETILDSRPDQLWRRLLVRATAIET
ncbi:MAG: YqgE/AlgH family protein [Burkholderiales bacterium]|nr:YqgE/AlgH family protein [Burkholderiales bacterium]